MVNQQLRRRAGLALGGAGALQLLGAFVMAALALSTPSSARYDSSLPGVGWEDFSVFLAGINLLTLRGMVDWRRSGDAGRGVDVLIAGNALFVLCDLAMIRLVGKLDGSTAALVVDSAFGLASVLVAGGMFATAVTALRTWATHRFAPLACALLG